MNHFAEILTLKLTIQIMQQKQSSIYFEPSSFALKFNLASLKTEVDKLDTDKLVPLPIDLSKLRDVVKNDVVKKAV